MFDKFTIVQLKKRDWEILDSGIVKTASVLLPENFEYDPEFLYMRVRGVSAGEFFGANKNLDYFPEKELIDSHETFLNAHAFKNHENKDIANAIGDVLASEWDDRMKGVLLTLRLDQRIAPSIVRGFEKGYMTDVSMGCRVDHVLCPYCGQTARTKKEYCDHLISMRGRIFDNGIKIYEINIKPRFHDISTVLNGAEKIAKVTNIYIRNNKVAAFDPESIMKAAAAYTAPLDLDLLKTASIEPPVIDLAMPAWRGQKSSLSEKLAEIKKEIQSQIVGLANNNLLSRDIEDATHDRAIFKLMGESYWDDAQCAAIAAKLKEIADQHNLSTIGAFAAFLDALDFAGIELAPAEFAALSRECSNINAAPVNTPDTQTPQTFMDGVDHAVEGARIPGMGLEEILNTIRRVIQPNMPTFEQKWIGADSPLTKAKIVIMRLKPHAPYAPVTIPTAARSQFSNLAADAMPQRSAYPGFLIPRLRSITLGKPQFDKFASAHYSDASSVDDSGDVHNILNTILYSAYQQRREDHLASADYWRDVEKFAAQHSDDFLEKCATPKKYRYPLKAQAMALPLIYGYSNYQKARINNGTEVSNLNRYVAENPDNAFIIQAVIAPKVYREGAKVAEKILAHGKRFLDKAVDVSSKIYVKNASEQFYEGDLFKDAALDARLLEVYTVPQLAALKIAALMYYDGENGAGDEALQKVALQTDDLAQYLVSMVDYATDHIEGLFTKYAAQQEFGVLEQERTPDFLNSVALVYMHARCKN